MSKELEQKAKELLEQTFPWKKISNENIAKCAMIEFAVEFAQQKTITLGTKLDENGGIVEKPDRIIDELTEDDLGLVSAYREQQYGKALQIYQKARTVKEWIEYAKELDALIDQIYTTTNIYSHPLEAISKIQKLTAKTK